jgi:hypothetical protein
MGSINRAGRYAMNTATTAWYATQTITIASMRSINRAGRVPGVSFSSAEKQALSLSPAGKARAGA